MVRPLRIEIEGGIFHVTSRGDRRGEIYRDKTDRSSWLSIFGNVCNRFNWVCHSYCLMTNHYHIVVETPEANLSRGMRQLNGVFAQAFNNRHNLVGHVFQGRFKSILVERDSYLLELARYVVLNPVRAKVSKNVEDWSWSSYQSIIGEVQAPAWLETDWILGQFHIDRARARALYIDFVRSGIGLPSIWDELKYGFILGSEVFLEEVSRKIAPSGNILEIPRAQRRALAMSLQDYENINTSTRKAMVEAYRSGAYTMTEIARHFGVHYTTVSRAVKAADNRRASDHMD